LALGESTQRLGGDMTGSHEPEAADPVLTAAQRARLRPTIDQQALETFLRLVPRYARAALWHFSEELEPRDAVTVIRQLGATAAQLSDFERVTTPENANEVCVVRITAHPPTKPHQRALWDAIEPMRSSGNC
jgi:hypothetical protein